MLSQAASLFTAAGNMELWLLDKHLYLQEGKSVCRCSKLFLSLFFFLPQTHIYLGQSPLPTHSAARYDLWAWLLFQTIAWLLKDITCCSSGHNSDCWRRYKMCVFTCEHVCVFAPHVPRSSRLVDNSEHRLLGSRYLADGGRCLMYGLFTRSRCLSRKVISVLED